MKNRKKMFAIILIAAVIITITACKSGKVDEARTEEDLTEDNSSSFSAQSVELPDSNLSLRDMASNGELVYFCGTNSEGMSLLYSLDAETNAITAIGYSTSKDAWAIGISPEGKLLSLESEDSEANDGSLKYTLFEMDERGSVLSELDLTPVAEKDGTAITGIMPTEKGTLVSMFNSVVLVNSEGKVEKSFDTHGNPRKIVRGAEGQILLCGMGQNGYEVEELSSDLQSKTTYVLDNIYSEAYDGWFSEGVFLADQSKIYSVNYRNDERKVLVDTLLNGINKNGFTCVSENTFLTFEDGSILLWTPGSGESAGGELVTLKMATYNIDSDLYSVISEFNKTNSKYKIEVNDYSTYDTAADSNAGLKILNTEIISGKTPDIFDLSELPVEIYKSKGLLEDLMPFIKNDDIIDYSELIESAVKTLSDDGKLYSFIPAFKITMAFGDSNSVGTREDWTTEKFLSVAESFEGQKVLSPSVTREWFIKYLLVFAADDYLSPTGSYNFNNNDFIKLLEFAASLPESNEGSWPELLKLRDGEQLLSILTTGVPVLDMMKFDSLFEGNSSPVGFPSEKGGRYALRTYMWLGMASTGEHKEGVWEFFSFLLGDSFQKDLWDRYYIPVRKDILIDEIEEEISSASEITNRIAMFDENGTETFLECGPPSSNLKDEILDIIDQIDCLSEYNEVIYNIVIDEASAYFDGTITAEEAASRIQSRADIYMSEQG